MSLTYSTHLLSKKEETSSLPSFYPVRTKSRPPRGTWSTNTRNKAREGRTTSSTRSMYLPLPTETPREGHTAAQKLLVLNNSLIDQKKKNGRVNFSTLRRSTLKTPSLGKGEGEKELKLHGGHTHTHTHQRRFALSQARVAKLGELASVSLTVLKLSQRSTAPREHKTASAALPASHSPLPA